MTTDHNADIAAAEARLAEVKAKVERLRATIESAWQTGRAGARRRYPAKFEAANKATAVAREKARPADPSRRASGANISAANSSNRRRTAASSPGVMHQSQRADAAGTRANEVLLGVLISNVGRGHVTTRSD